jgi:hypothetical protein
MHLHKLELKMFILLLMRNENAEKSATQNVPIYFLLHIALCMIFPIRSKCFLSFINVLCVSYPFISLACFVEIRKYVS